MSKNYENEQELSEVFLKNLHKADLEEELIEFIICCVDSLCTVADEYGENRDSIIRKFATAFYDMALNGSFETYENEEETNND